MTTIFSENNSGRPGPRPGPCFVDLDFDCLEILAARLLGARVDFSDIFRFAGRVDIDRISMLAEFASP